MALSGAELTVGGESYPLADVSAVTTVREAAPANGPILMLVAGGACLLSASGTAGLWGVAAGVVLIAVAIVWWTRKKPIYKLRFETPAGELFPYESADPERARRLAEAVEDARRTAGAPTPEQAP